VDVDPAPKFFWLEGARMSSQVIDEVEMEPQENIARVSSSPDNEFHYRPVSSLAVCSLVLGLLSLVGIFLWIMLPVAVLTVILGGIAILSIRRWQGEYTGTGVAIAGIFFGAVTLLAGTGVQVHAFQHEVPPGFTRISFIKDISAKPFVSDRNGAKVNPDVEALVGQKVFFKGFVYPTDQYVGLTSFLLLKDSKECCFGGKPALTDKVGCIMQGGKSTNYYAGRVSVAGTFRINPNFHEDALEALYILECEIVEPSHSDF
jgi:hypothetical protein